MNGMNQPGTDSTERVSLSPTSLLVHAGFVLNGVLTTLLGPILPMLSSRWALADAQAGYFFTAQFLGSTAGSLFCSWLLALRGFPFALLVGFGLMAVGVSGMGLGVLAAGILSVVCYGVGLGVTNAACNLFVSEANAGRRAAALSVLNMLWGLGAVTCPFLVSLAQRGANIGAFLYGLAIACGLVAVCVVAVPFAGVRRPPRNSDRFGPPGSAPGKNRNVSLLALMFFIYVGTENSVGGWVASYAKRMSVGADTIWMLTPSFFWGGLLLGRATAPVWLGRVSEARLLRAGLLLAAGGVSILLWAPTMLGVAGGAALAGLGLAAVFPLLVALMSHRYGVFAARMAGSLFALGGLGGATLPWLVGICSTRLSSLRAGLVIPLLGSMALATLHFFVQDERRSGSRSREEPRR